MDKEKIFFENYNNKILPSLLENSELRCMCLLNEKSENKNTYSDSVNSLEVMLRTKTFFIINPSFDSKINFIKNIFTLDVTLNELFPDENNLSLLDIYFHFISFTFISFIDNNLPIKNLIDAPITDENEISNPLNFSKREKLLINAFFTFKDNPLENYNSQWVDKVLNLLLFNNTQLPEENNETQNLNIIIYKNLIINGFNKEKLCLELHSYWKNLSVGKLDNLFSSLDIKSLIGICNYEGAIFNSPRLFPSISSNKWFYLHDDIKDIAYSPLKSLIKDSDFIEKIKNILNTKLYTFLIKNSLLPDFEALIELKTSMGEESELSINDFMNYLAYNKLNEFIIEPQNIPHLKKLMLNKNLLLYIDVIKNSSWAKKAFIGVYRSLKCKNEKEITSKVFNEIVYYDFSKITTETTLKEMEYLNKEFHAFSVFSNYDKENLLKDKFLFLFRLMAFAFANQRIKYKKSKIEDFIKENYESFYWIFLKEYATFIGDENKYKSGNFSFSYENSNLQYNGINIKNTRVVEFALKELLFKKINDISKLNSNDDNNEDEAEFKI